MLLASISFVVAAFLSAFLFNLIDDFVLHWFLGMSRQTVYNMMLFCALLIAGILYATVILRMRRFEVQDALKSGESVRTVVMKRFLIQNLIFLCVFAVCAFVLVRIGVAEGFTTGATPRTGKYILSTECEGFFGWERFLLACGAFVPIIPWGWLAWLCSVASYALLLWGGTWWFVRRTDRKLLGKKQNGAQ